MLFRSDVGAPVDAEVGTMLGSALGGVAGRDVGTVQSSIAMGVSEQRQESSTDKRRLSASWKLELKTRFLLLYQIACRSSGFNLA